MFKLIYRKYGDRLRLKDDLLSGLTVALALVPEAVAFAFVAGVLPVGWTLRGLFYWTHPSVFGGRQG